ncbi:hypothetical protein CPB84DRAFT_1670444 [Gymnopilus junonius]|uniref:F-box domain-containing protein n=1 Tax=Gymnopilus junonius TaxID=109634 RepID=A0A9P5P1T7_GYMJU|nr:hypothetical protein CPB84DRAFT_1670444 [Gymnopilus junonius]
MSPFTGNRGYFIFSEKRARHRSFLSSHPPWSPLPVFGFPVELTQHILSFCHPWDVANFSLTCSAAYILIYHASDQYLWRHLYNTSFDLPFSVADPTNRKEQMNWKDELTSRMRVELALFSCPMTHSEKLRMLRMLITVIQDSSWAISRTGTSRNTAWLGRIMRQSLLLHNLYSVPESDSEEDAQLYAQLRAYLALIIDLINDKKSLSKLIDRRDLSRAYVYNLLHYNAENKWGPFLPDGRVNWIHAEHLIDVVALNVRELPGSWALTRPPSCLDPPRLSAIASSSFHKTDWQGLKVSTWRRYVCFMDYRTLLSGLFFYRKLTHPKFFKDPRFREATRLVEVKLHVVPCNQLRFHRTISNATPDHDIYPPLYFTGSSKGVNGNEAAVEGLVTMGQDGKARWQLISIYDGHPQWSSSGAQIGGIGSAMGVIGVWTTTHHDQDDPAGPFWLWKVEDNSPTHLMEFT